MQRENDCTFLSGTIFHCIYCNRKILIKRKMLTKTKAENSKARKKDEKKKSKCNEIKWIVKNKKVKLCNESNRAKRQKKNHADEEEETTEAKKIQCHPRATTNGKPFCTIMLHFYSLFVLNLSNDKILFVLIFSLFLSRAHFSFTRKIFIHIALRKRGRNKTEQKLRENEKKNN